MSARSFRRSHTRRIARERRRAGVLKRKGTQIAGLALTSGALFTANAVADTYTVTTTGDDATAAACTAGMGTGAFNCGTLRDAVGAADAQTSASTIDFASGLTGTITLTNGALPLSGTTDVTITGPGASTLTVSGDKASQIFDDTSTADTDAISDLTLTEGDSGTSAPGGAIDVSKDVALNLTGDTISSSTSGDTSEGGGAVYTDTEGSLTISDSTLSGNTSANKGGAVYVHHTDGDDQPTLTINDSTITGNTAANGGGGIFGAKYTTITGSHITGNTQTGTGNDYGGGIATEGGSLVIDDSTVSGNTSAGLGGGIGSASKYGVTIENSTVSGNTAGDGGGFEQIGLSHIEGDAATLYNPVTIQNSTISGNRANIGAGVNIYGVAEGDPVKIEASTISGNIGTGTKSAGGGLAVTPKYDGSNELYSVKSPIDVVDSTISGNSASVGGGVTVGDPSFGFPVFGQGQTQTGSLTFDNSTVDGNSSTGAGGGIYLDSYTTSGSPAVESATVTVKSTIVAGNTGGDLARASGSTSGGFDSAFSLIQTPGSAPMLSEQSDILGESPLLGPLTNNSGPTETMLPSGTSPVIDQGHAPKSETTDQRGDPRTVDVTGIPKPPGGDGTDIGSVELPASSVPTVFTSSLRGTLLSSAVSPLLPGTASPIDCIVRIGTLTSCVIHVVSGGKVVADGDAQNSAGAATLPVSLTPTAAGLSLIKKHPLGITAPATVSGSGNGGPQTSAGNVDVIAGPLFTIPTGKTDNKAPSKTVKGELKQVAQLLVGAGAKSITCTAYTKKGPHKGKNDKSTTTAESKAVCGYVDIDGFKGKSKPVGKGHTIAANQVVISFTL
jgi:hypothetical protein